MVVLQSCNNRIVQIPEFGKYFGRIGFHRIDGHIRIWLLDEPGIKMLDDVIVVRGRMFPFVKTELYDLTSSRDNAVGPVKIVDRVERDIHGASLEGVMNWSLFDEGDVDFLPEAEPVYGFSESTSEGTMMFLRTHQKVCS